METNASASVNTMGKDEFLRLFTTQLKYQDPLNPLDSAGFTAQLAQFSSLEQLYNLSSGLQDLAAGQRQVNNAAAAWLIGWNIRAEDGVTGRVTGIGFDKGSANIMLDNGATVAFGDIQEIF